mgnify:FL=1
MSRLFELCAAVRDGSARPEDVRELASLAEKAQKKVDAAKATMETWKRLSKYGSVNINKTNAYAFCCEDLRKAMEDDDPRS